MFSEFRKCTPTQNAYVSFFSLIQKISETSVIQSENENCFSLLGYKRPLSDPRHELFTLEQLTSFVKVNVGVLQSRGLWTM